jgi:hypothetical protein
MRFSKRLSKSALLGILSMTLVFCSLPLMSGCAINEETTVALITQLATNFANSCAALTANPICVAAAAAIKPITAEIQAAHNAWILNPTASTLARLTAAVQAAIQAFPAILASVNVPDAGNLSLALNLILSTVQILATFFGIASTAVTVALTMRIGAAAPGVVIKYGWFHHPENEVRSAWNGRVCGVMKAGALKLCEVN